MKVLSLALACVLFSFVSCTANDSDSVITIGTFNIEWLGDGDSTDVKPRTEEDYKNIATIIEQTHADILGVEEIENSAAMMRVLKYLPEYHFAIGHAGRAQNVGVIYKSSVTLGTPVEYLPIATRGERNRPGFLVECTKKNFHCMLMVVHLKSTSRADSTKELKIESYVNRREQVHVLRQWLDSTLTVAKQPDVLIVGDFNDFPQREQNPTLTELLADTNAVFLTREQHSCRDPKWYSIDHIVTSPHLTKRWHQQSMGSVNVHASLTKKQADGVSDHCPVLTDFDCLSKDE